MGEIKVHIDYRNSQMDVVSKKDYSFRDYTEMLRSDVLRMISEVEDFCYDINDNKQKDEWSEESWMFFMKMKHKLLDKAGELGRLPDNVSFEGCTCRK